MRKWSTRMSIGDVKGIVPSLKLIPEVSGLLKEARDALENHLYLNLGCKYVWWCLGASLYGGLFSPDRTKSALEEGVSPKLGALASRPNALRPYRQFYSAKRISEAGQWPFSSSPEIGHPIT